MVERRFSDLREALLKIGVTPRKACCAMLELEAHFNELMEEEIRRGAGEHDARIEAQKRLGTNETLIQCYAARPELRAWAHRWPAVWFTLLPLISYLVLSCLTMMIVYAIVDHMAPYLHQIRIAPAVSHRIDLSARILFLWLFPLLVAGAFAVSAYRRRVASCWPSAGILAVSALASLINVGVMLTGGVPAGETSAGIGFSPKSLPEQMTHAVVVSLFALVPLWLAMRRIKRDAHA